MADRVHIVISVHGIRTYGQWQQRLGTLLGASGHQVEYHAYTYGYFSAIAFLIPPLRWLVVRRFREALLRLVHGRTDARVDLVGHSFGTHILAWALLNTRPYLRPKIHTIILAGSVLKPAFPWQVLLDSGEVRRVVNDCGIHDWVLVLNQLTVLFTGMAGRYGLAGLTGDRLMNRYFPGGHSLYFVDSAGSDRDSHMVACWIPLLIGESPPLRADERGVPTLWTGLVQTLVQNSEPIKLAIYAATLAIPGVVYYNLYEASERQRTIAEEQRGIADQERARAVSERERNLFAIERSTNLAMNTPASDGLTPSTNITAVELLGRLMSGLLTSGYNGPIKIEYQRGG